MSLFIQREAADLERKNLPPSYNGRPLRDFESIV